MDRTQLRLKQRAQLERIEARAIVPRELAEQSDIHPVLSWFAQRKGVFPFDFVQPIRLARNARRPDTQFGFPPARNAVADLADELAFPIAVLVGPSLVAAQQFEFHLPLDDGGKQDFGGGVGECGG